MGSTTLRGLWEAKLRELYSAEQQIVAKLPEMINAAGSADLKEALDRHLQRTKIHVERLELIFKQCGLNSTGAATKQPSAIDGIVRSGSELIQSSQDADVRDAAIIAAAQHVEHYEMAGYGCVRTWARRLDERNAARLLQQTLDEEGAADKQLSDIAESGINQGASADDAGARSRYRLRYVDVEDVPSTAAYRDVKVRNGAGDDLGRVDGFILDDSGRPYYLVVDSGALFVGRRYVVPIGRTDFRRGDRQFTIDMDKDTLKRYPEFHRDTFLSMNDAEARRYEWRVLEAIDPNAARSSVEEWDYDKYPYYRQPEWFERGTMPPRERSIRTETTTSERRDIPIVEREDRERVVAREDTYTGKEPPRRGRDELP